MRRAAAGVLVVAAWIGSGAPALAQESAAPAGPSRLRSAGEDEGLAATVATGPPQPAPSEVVNPWDERPVCASMFLKADWQLSPKQRACAWLHDGVFSTNALLGAVWSAGFSQQVDLSSERGDSFAARFGRKFGQSAIKSTAIYLGSVISREDTRSNPPYLVMRAESPPRGFFRRLGRAIAGNVISTTCVNRCQSEADIRPRFVLSKLAGSIASGFSGELMTTDRPDSLNHALRGSASAYAATFGNAIFEEFRPELSAFASRIFRTMGGSR
jgi:hypothetical protein